MPKASRNYTETIPRLEEEIRTLDVYPKGSKDHRFKKEKQRIINKYGIGETTFQTIRKN